MNRFKNFVYGFVLSLFLSGIGLALINQDWTYLTNCWFLVPIYGSWYVVEIIELHAPWIMYPIYAMIIAVMIGIEAVLRTSQTVINNVYEEARKNYEDKHK